jgi:hypothetical protein
VVFDGPAAKAGIKAQDTIVTIDGVGDLLNVPISEIGALLQGDAGTDVTLTIRKKLGDGSPEKVTLTREATNVVPKKRVNDQEGGGGLFTVRTTFWLSQIPDDCLPILVPEGTIYYHCRLSARNYSYTWPYKTDTLFYLS